MDRTLIVARIKPNTERDVAAVFARSDEDGELPRLMGVRSRSLFRFHDLYFHLVELEGDGRGAVENARSHELFQAISRDLVPFIDAYDPATWRSPADAMAHEFYRYERPVGREEG
jgi:cyclase